MNLAEALLLMRDKLRDCGLEVPQAPTRLFEVPRPAPLIDGRLAIGRRALIDPHAYASRFRYLAREANFAWINVSAYGLLDGVLVVGIELPLAPASRPSCPTSINISGPPFAVLDAEWNVAAAFAIVP